MPHQNFKTQFIKIRKLWEYKFHSIGATKNYYSLGYLQKKVQNTKIAVLKRQETRRCISSTSLKWKYVGDMWKYARNTQ